MTYPTGYDSTPIAPHIYIFDHNFREKFQWQHPQFSEDFRQDFHLESWKISGGINSSVGSAEIIIEDDDKNFTNQNNRAGSKIQAGDLMQIFLGKQNLESWFYGICDEPEVVRPGYNQQQIKVKAVGYGIRLASRFISIDHQQATDSNGDLDNSDNTARVSEIVKRILTDDSLMALPPHDSRLNITPVIDDGQILVEAIRDVDIKIATYSKVNRTQASLISELANISNCVYGVDPDLNFYFRPSNIPSDWQITNNLQTNTNPSRQMYIRNQSYSYQDSTVRNAHTSLIGTDITQERNTEDSGGTLQYNTGDSTFYVYEIEAEPFKTVDILLRAFISIFGDAVTNWAAYTSEGLFNPETATRIASGTIDIDTPILDRTSIGGTERPWYRLQTNFKKPENDQITHWLTFQTNKTGGGGHIPYRKAGGFRYGTYFEGGTFSQGSNYTVRHKGRIESKVRLLAQNTTLKHLQLDKENIQNLRTAEASNTATQIFEGLLDLAGRVRRNYSNLTCSVPDSRPELGKTIRIIDQFQNLDAYALLIGYDISSDKSENLTTVDIKLELEEWL